MKTSHFTPFFLLSNARRIVSREYAQRANWVIAMELFAVGSTTAKKICIDAGIDPDARTVSVVRGIEPNAKEPAL